MKIFSCAALAVAAAILGQATVNGAEIDKFRHIVSVYFDEKGTGLKLPEGVACNSKGLLIVADTANDRLVRFTFLDKNVSGGTEIKLPELTAPSRVQLTSKGDIYALDEKRRRIARIGPDGVFKGAVSFETAPTPGAIIPKSFVIDAADNLYVLDELSARVLVLNADGQFQRAVALPDDRGFVSDVAVDMAGNILVIDSIKRRMFSAGKDATSFAPLGGPLSDVVTTMPTFMTTSSGMIFIVEGSGSSIVTLARDGTFLARQLTLGWVDGALNHPAQMCINEKGEAFVADRDNARVQAFALIR